MNITDVNSAVKAHKRRRRVGRGNASGQGTTAGRGSKGFGQHSGKSILGFEGGQMQLFRTTPKRGFNNHAFRVEYVPVNLHTLERAFEAGDVVDPAALQAKGVSKKVLRVKILGTGELTKALTVKAHAFSKGAIEKIEAAGGTVEVVPVMKRKPRKVAADAKTEES